MYPEIYSVNGDTLKNNDILYLKPVDVYIVPNDKEELFVSDNPKKIFLLHSEIKLLFWKKVDKNTLRAIMLIKRIFNDSKLVMKEPPITHLYC